MTSRWSLHPMSYIPGVLLLFDGNIYGFYCCVLLSAVCIWFVNHCGELTDQTMNELLFELRLHLMASVYLLFGLKHSCWSYSVSCTIIYPEAIDALSVEVGVVVLVPRYFLSWLMYSLQNWQNIQCLIELQYIWKSMPWGQAMCNHNYHLDNHMLPYWAEHLLH